MRDIGRRTLEVYIAEKVRTIEYYKKHIANLKKVNPPKDAEQLAEKYGKIIEELEKDIEETKEEYRAEEKLKYSKDDAFNFPRILSSITNSGSSTTSGST